jgi:hypothetical protein
MTTVFVAGSISIKRLHPLFLERLDTIVKSDFNVIVGDADGADRSIQQALLERGATRVTVYCTGNKPRNNIGSWNVQTVSSGHNPGSRAFFTAKAVQMAKVADYGLMMWDAKSTGTLSNVIELLQRERSSRVFVNKEQQFITTSDAEGLKKLVGMMSEGARAKADDKIGLTAKLAAISRQQFDLVLEEGRLPSRSEVEAPTLSAIPADAEDSQQSREPVIAPETDLIPPRSPDLEGPGIRSEGRDASSPQRFGVHWSVKTLLMMLLLLIALGTIFWFRD